MSKEHPLIAVIDDEEAVRKGLGRLLESSRMVVETYSSGAEFLASLAGHHPDCAVLDLHMPDMTGFDVLERLVKSGTRVPAVVITGRDNPEAEGGLLRGGATAYLRKPVNKNLLLKAISAAMASSDSNTPSPDL